MPAPAVLLDVSPEEPTGRGLPAASIPFPTPVPKLSPVHRALSLPRTPPPALWAPSDYTIPGFDTAGTAGVMLGLASKILRRGTGRALMAIRDSETAAVASGVSLC